MNAQTILLILLGVALVFGLGVVFLNRRTSANDGASSSAQRTVEEPRAAAPPSVAPTREESGAVVATPESAPEPEPAPEPEKQPDRPSFRDRLGKTALAMAGVFGGVRARGGITADTWDDLEEVLLKADVGVGVTDALLDGLRARVKSNEIDGADALLAALQAEMSSRLEGADRALTFAEVADGHVNVWLFVGVNGVGIVDLFRLHPSTQSVE
ncbi:MAG: hypothetical protein EBZ93_12975, partial [Actinobacteria bacterium]|nr:hypothetical protein [Actinomycetota bacterium]